MKTGKVFSATAFGVSLFLGGAAFGTTLDASLIQTAGKPSVAAGKFYGYQTPTAGPGDAAFSDALALARSAHVPLVVIWSNEDCHYCDSFTANLNTSKAKVAQWLKSERAVFAFFKDNSGDYAPTPGHQPAACYDAWAFASKTCGSQPVWPLIGFYYERTDGTSARWWHGNVPNKTFDWLKKAYADWVEENHIGSSPGSGAFAVAGTPDDRYEAEASTRHADVELVRDAGVAFGGVTNVLYAFWPKENGPYFTTNVVWEADETSRQVRVPLTHGAFPGAGEEIVLKLADGWGNAVAETPVACVAPELSASNPKWIGEDVGFGEWTMDLDAATQMVARADGAAYTVVSMQGSKWCPDCANVERNFLDVTNAAGENAFMKWAAANSVALVSVDIPNFTDMEGGFSTPTLLSRKAAQSTLARKSEYPQSGADESLLVATLRSGTGYLTRKGVDDETAARYLDRNHFLASANTDRGGFHRPEDGNPRRTGVPIFVLLRKDGTVAARLTRMASVSPMAADRANFDNYIRRFEEMMAVAAESGAHADGGEISNNYPDAGATVVSVGGVASGELCHADFQDTFRIDGAGGGSYMRATAQGPDGVAAVVSVVTTNAAGAMVTVASGSGDLGDGVSVVAELGEDVDYFVQVKGKDITDASFALESPDAGHFHAYELRTDVLLVPTDRTATSRAPSGSTRLAMRVAAGEKYRIAGIAEPSAAVFREVGEPPLGRAGTLYEALVSEDVELTAAAAGGEVEFQRWRPGKVSFASYDERVLEYAGTGTVSVVRTDGGSNAETVTVYCAACETGAEGRFECPTQQLVWEDGETGAKEVGFVLIGDDAYQGDASFTLALAHDEESPVALVAPLTTEVTICDTDAPCFEREAYAVSAVRSFTSSAAFKVINVREGGRISVACTDGTKLPAGMTAKYDKATGEIVLSGIPTKAGTYTFTCRLTEYRRGGRATGFTTTITLTVAEPADTNPFAAKARPSQKLALYETDGFGQERLVGYLDAAITSKGRISAKYAGVEAKTVSFAGSWAEFNGFGSAHAVLTAKGGETLDLTLDTAGTLHANLYGGQVGDLSASASWPETGVFDAFKGYYTATLATNGVQTTDVAQGTAYLALTMTSAACVRSGTVRYAGVLSDGSAVSGSVALRNATPKAADLPVFCRTSRNVLGVAVRLGSDGATNWTAEDANLREVVVPLSGTMPYVLHREAEFDYVLGCEIAGVWYKPGISPATLYDLFYYQYGSGTPFTLRFDGEEAGVVRVKGTRLALDRTSGLSFSFASRTGVFSGSARLTVGGRTVSGQYRGIVTPGWINSCECGIVAPERPFGGGTFYYRDRVDGKTCTRSLPVVLDVLGR